MEKLNLVAEVRSTTEKLSEVRAAKNIPAVIYGHNAENMIIKMNNSDFLRTFRKSGESHIISLEVAGKKYDVLVHDIQREPVSGDFLHIDFIFVIKGENVHTNIPLNFINTSAASKEGAIIEEHLKDLEVKCLPTDLVDAFDVDLSLLTEMGTSIRVSDLGISDKYTVLTVADTIIVSATQPAKIEVIEDSAPEAPVMEGDEEKA
jgi:large subunit ribosomal protein L25